MFVVERGILTGTFPGHIEIATHVEERRATFKIVTHAGAFEGYAQDNYAVSGTHVNVALDAQVIHGAGLYTHAKSRGLLIVGGFTIGSDDANYNVTGTLSY